MARRQEEIETEYEALVSKYRAVYHAHCKALAEGVNENVGPVRLSPYRLAHLERLGKLLERLQAAIDGLQWVLSYETREPLSALTIPTFDEPKIDLEEPKQFTPLEALQIVKAEMEAQGPIFAEPLASLNPGPRRRG